MPLLLKEVDAASGGRWVRDALRLYLRRPFAFTGLFALFMLFWLLLGVVPLAGALLQTLMPPILSLGFMIASQSALLDGPVHARLFVEPLRGDVKRRRALLGLCLLYGACTAGSFMLSDAVAGGGLARLWQAWAGGNVPPQELEALLTDPGVSAAVMLMTALLSLISVLFWHAPALVHWGEQGIAQALFSSTLAVWRCKGAFLVYALAWMGLLIGTSVGVTLLALLLGRGLAQLLAMAGGLFLSTLFYVSLLFTFNDSFGGTETRLKA